MSEPKSHVTVQRKYVLGIRANLHGSVHFLSDDEILYVASNVIVLLQTDSKDQRFIEISKRCDEICAVAVSPNRRLIGVAERGHGNGTENRVVLNIYSSDTLRRKKTIMPRGGVTDIVHFSFSSDSKSCLILSKITDTENSNHYSLSLWNLDAKGAAKVAASTSFSAPGGKSICMANISPHSYPDKSSVISLTGDSVLRFFRLIDIIFRPVTVKNIRSEPQNLTTQAWLSCGRLAIGTEVGDLLLVDNFEVKTVPISQKQCNSRIYSIAEFSKGIVVGRAGGFVQLYNHLDDDRKVFSLSRQLNLKGDSSSLTNLSISPRGDSLICSTADNNMYSLPLSSSNILDEEEGSHFEFILPPFHRPDEFRVSEITCIDVCIWKSIVATGGRDQTVRIWNYVDQKMELAHHFDNAIVDISLHPSGLSILVCMAHSVEYCALLSDSLETTWLR